MCSSTTPESWVGIASPWMTWTTAPGGMVKRREVAAGGVEIETGPVRNDIVAIVAGVVVYLLFVWKLHLWLFGVPPVVL
ncbi:MAG: NnrU family protein, partial [Pseudomonadota bacterium]